MATHVATLSVANGQRIPSRRFTESHLRVLLPTKGGVHLPRFDGVRLQPRSEMTAEV